MTRAMGSEQADIIFAGGGLASCVAALRICEELPDCRKQCGFGSSLQALAPRRWMGEAEGAVARKKRFSMSLFVVYFGLRGERPHLRHHMVLFGLRYRELIRDIFHGDGLADDFSLYLHCPSATDESLAPSGHSAYYVLSPVPHLGTAPIDWPQMVRINVVLPDPFGPKRPNSSPASTHSSRSRSTAF